MKKNVILADCEPEEVMTFRDGLEEATGKKWEILSVVCNKYHGSKWKTLLRYLTYFKVAWHAFMHRNEYETLIGWQQFYANIFAFYCNLFKVKKPCRVVSVNFTYKRKIGGGIGDIHYRFMRFAINNPYLDFLHVPSNLYADRCSHELGVDRSQFIVTPFGIPDSRKELLQTQAPAKDYVLSIGRSNRDFDFLLRVWRREEMKDLHLVLIADTYTPKEPLPSNVTHLKNVVGEAARPWQAHCELMILPIDDGNIASGDTVLLTGMQMEKVVVITRPSTLAEMYIHDGVDGVVLDKEETSFAEKILALMNDAAQRKKIGEQARQTYLEKFSRQSMGRLIGQQLVY